MLHDDFSWNSINKLFFKTTDLTVCLILSSPQFCRSCVVVVLPFSGLVFRGRTSTRHPHQCRNPSGHKISPHCHHCQWHLVAIILDSFQPFTLNHSLHIEIVFTGITLFITHLNSLVSNWNVSRIVFVCYKCDPFHWTIVAKFNNGYRQKRPGEKLLRLPGWDSSEAPRSGGTT